jgi:hypothetical protein
MTGEIRGRDVALNAALVVRGFGWTALLRCIVAVLRRERVTFLSLALRL